MKRCLGASLLACFFLAAGQLPAANRYFFQNQSVPAGGTGIGILLRADIDQTIYGFSFGVNYDEAVLRVTAVTLDGTSIAPGAPDFFDGTLDQARGLIGYGCVLDFGPPFADVLPAGTDQRIANLVVDVLGAPGTSTQVVLETVPTNPDPDRPVKNVMTNDQGQSIIPVLAAGTITVEDRKPQITELIDNAGMAGEVFQVKGLFFQEAELSVKVCGVEAAHVLQGADTLDVTAPECPVGGTQPVEVCNTWGCDNEADGFSYLAPGGSQRAGDGNQDGKLDISDGLHLLGHLFLGTFAVLPCGNGLSSHAANKKLLDTNQSGAVDLSDVIYNLSFLFTGGPPPVLGTGCIIIEECPDKCVE